MSLLHTIGHSTRSLDEFVALLRENGVGAIADVRSIPRSRTNPQFNRETLPEALAARGIGYTHYPQLGGRRGKRRDDSPNGWWEVPAFRNYADYALTPPFAEGLAALRAEAASAPVAVMCAEAVWWRCHRRIVADWLLAAGEAVVHILGPGHPEPASLTPAAVVGADGSVTYPP